MNDDKQIEDLDVDPAEAADVKGGDKAQTAPSGKLQTHDLNFTHLSDKATPTLG
jgi:type VI protein secretion system component Hcp